MNCPACRRDLVELKLTSMTVNVCKGGCAGMWFDHFGLQKVEYSSAHEGEALLAIEKDPNLQVNSNRKRNCPKCSVVMMQHFFSVKKQVTVDECPKCAGYWLDGGELATIRSEFSSEKERQTATDKYFSDSFGKQLNAGDKQDEIFDGRVRKIQNALGIISLSNYTRKSGDTKI